MEPRAQENSAPTTSRSSHTPHHEGRNVWILTVYGIAGLAMFGVLAYYISAYITQ
jgi:hypothetical protein